MKIALAHFRVGETDGVSLEIEKWKQVLKQMGHEVLLLAGSEGQVRAHVIAELHYKYPMNEKFVYNAYDNMMDYDSEKEFVDDVIACADIMERKIVDFIATESIDLLITHNLFSLGWSLPAGIAFTNALKVTGIPCMALHHNFYWQRERYLNPTCPTVTEWLNTLFPPDLPNVTHVVTNRLYHDELMQHRKLNAAIIPNVFDFNAKLWERDDFNASLRSDIGVNEDDIVILQATRVTERKAIELGIDTVAGLQAQLASLKQRNTTLYNGKTLSDRNRLVYVLAGMPESSYEYTEKLRIKAETLGIDIRFINPLIDQSRSYAKGQKRYSLWDAYVIADFVTFPSVIEGWGNQLLEAVFAQKPILIYEYPVYQKDIKEFRFDIVSLGNTHQIEANGLASVKSKNVKAAATKMAQLLTDEDAYTQMVQHNFKIGNMNFSYESLHLLLEPLLEEVTR
ncbi:glycosyltransferase family 4 protein [Paenibacillus sp. V4I5]|uniref:glycosyltransferase family 4 protein n=1 Tax=Paenibacillus sp. V4I5 TaxID=3042306 RepID=UPI0027903EC8|nr:glycosyltransferase family 4 protein [Paenibacillus sp. V4I5]MDQ0913924.1 glycosyltransferase involved in cell wall biosynthesis [Paenibacillus sp. V4I5]